MSKEIKFRMQDEVKQRIVDSFKKRTGNKNMIGSIEKVVDELFVDINNGFFEGYEETSEHC